ncbi:hypothetical protein LHP98_02485 [Rhodobacter sp. Har01]|uniref:DUF6544 family protein n=1 Tax=Rhodobacter sp. Har01 TaxID=2883999 RepID=UPI001D078AE1|nr:DUF6544 family protein [Rhodobacter sp. Har01]MCB6176996.1 hypothetical protein [Rhodobacter sp. Har01]
MSLFQIILGLFLAGSVGWAVAQLRGRSWDARDNDALWAEVQALQPKAPARFDAALLEGVPEPAARFFRFAIAPATPLWTVAEIDMGGEFGLGDRANPKYAPMTAQQILGAPQGFVWKMRSGTVSGSDGLGAHGSWTRFRLFGLVQVAREGMTEDHRRSAFARAVAEGLFWTPARFLPGPGVDWQATGPDSARLTVSHGGLVQSVELTVGPDGAPVSMVMPRWTNANPLKRWQVQPFGATFGGFRDFAGFRLPTEVEAGNHFGTPDYFAFFKARVTEVRFPH